MMRQRGTGRLYKQRGCALWSIQYYRNGRRVREATGTDNRKVAERKLRERLAQIATATYVSPRLERIKVADLWEPFRLKLNNRGSGLKHPTRRWTKHLEPFFGHLRAADVGTDHLNAYVNARRAQDAGNASINREIAVLRGMFRLGYFSTPPKLRSLPKFPHCDEPPARKGFMKPEQYDALADITSKVGVWMRTMFEVYYTWGWRKSELLTMRVRHVDFNANVIRLDPEMVKNEEGREVTMTPTIRALVMECAEGKNDEDFLFTRDNGTPVRDFRKTWRNLCIAAGVPALHVHDMRRTAARNLVRAGVSQDVAMKITGHKTASVFKRYNITDQSDISNAMLKLEQARFEHKVGHNAPTGSADNASHTSARPN